MKITKEFKIGLVVVCAIAALIWGISFLKGANVFSQKSYLYAVYPKIENLIPANPVQIRGFKIGQVSKISLIQKGGETQVLVQMVITEDADIPKNSIARAISSDLLGTKAIDIAIGNGKDLVKDGDTLVAETEQGLKESFNKQLAPIQAKAENLLGSMDTVMNTLSLLLSTKNRDNIDKSFESVRNALKSLEQTAFKLDALMASEKEKLSAILGNLSAITNNLHQNEKKIDNILSNFSTLSDSLAKSELKSAITNADKTLKEMNELLARINAGQGTLGKLAKNDSLYNNLNKSSEDLDKLLQDLRKNPKRYVHFSIFGKKDKDKPKD
ncbi:MAG: MCE family protein [Bacteroidetes bacterium]|nr:MCE family protein [Bacteroidota bacterium]